MIVVLIAAENPKGRGGGLIHEYRTWNDHDGGSGAGGEELDRGKARMMRARDRYFLKL